MGFSESTFDIILCGFMGWDDCFDFSSNIFTRPDTKITEIYRLLRRGGRFVCCSWESQQDLAWMEAAMLRHHPSLIDDADYIQHRPVGMSYENAPGYELILRSAGFVDIQVLSITADFISTDEDEWWRQMDSVGWGVFFKKLTMENACRFLEIKQAIVDDLQQFKHEDGICFSKTAFFVSGVK